MGTFDILEEAFCEAALTGEPILVAKRDGFQFAYEYFRDPTLSPEEMKKRLISATIALEHGLAVLMLFLKEGGEEDFMKNFSQRVMTEMRMLSIVIPVIKLLGKEKALKMIRERGEEERAKRSS